MKNTNKKVIIRLLVIEDNPTLLLAGLRNYFRPERDLIQIYESASCVEDTIDLAGHDAFDLILLGLKIPGNSPDENIKFLNNQFPGRPILIYTSFDSNLWRKRMFDLGVQGYVHKNDSRDTLKRAIVDAFEGKTTFSTNAGTLPDAVLLPIGIMERTLSIEETEILKLLAGGVRYKQIGKTLNINDVTIDTVMKRVRKKFGATSTPQLMYILAKSGLL